MKKFANNYICYSLNKNVAPYNEHMANCNIQFMQIVSICIANIIATGY